MYSPSRDLYNTWSRSYIAWEIMDQLDLWEGLVVSTRLVALERRLVLESLLTLEGPFMLEGPDLQIVHSNWLLIVLWPFYSRPREGGSPKRRLALKGGSNNKKYVCGNEIYFESKITKLTFYKFMCAAIFRQVQGLLWWFSNIGEQV